MHNNFFGKKKLFTPVYELEKKNLNLPDVKQFVKELFDRQDLKEVF